MKSQIECTSLQKSVGSDPDEPHEEVPVIETKMKPKHDKAKIWIARCCKGNGFHDTLRTGREIGSFCYACVTPWAMKGQS